MDGFASENNLFFPGEFILDAGYNSIHVLTFMNKIQVIGSEGEHRTDIKPADPFVVITIQ